MLLPRGPWLQYALIITFAALEAMKLFLLYYICHPVTSTQFYASVKTVCVYRFLAAFDCFVVF